MKGNTLVWLGLGALLLYGLSKNQTAGDGAPTTQPGTTEQTTLQAWIERIKATPEWYQLILDKMQSTGFTLQQQLEHDAQWMIDQGYQL